MIKYQKCSFCEEKIDSRSMCTDDCCIRCCENLACEEAGCELAEDYSKND